ncbi:hypothetical protein DPMN_032899 [Dreissena polymorpha]|uniref:Cadherin domain-containing protein n=1 Tax=Dreissena polymorpha TaxID=45954 RepID=A0A9D4RKQ3_DREPO|nr:hypothetical protein DPMN_032899 [Dreissena polymorpha]
MVVVVILSPGEIRKYGDLDRETNSSIVLTINVTDNGNPPLWSTLDITVDILDVNDNTPVFEKADYNVTVLENITDGLQILHVNASDKDEGQNGNVSFTLDVGNDNSFGIDPITGIISVKDHSLIDRERKETYILQIIAKDNPTEIIEQRSASQQLTIVIDDVNDNAPEFTNGGNYYVKAREDLNDGTFVIKVSATDKDKTGTPNGKISYKIENSTGVGLFKIDSKTGDISTNQSLQGHYGNVTLDVKAEDSGEPKLNGTAIVVIFIDDVNLNKPIIIDLPASNTIGVYECIKVNQELYKFNYTDADKGNNAKATFNMSVVEGSPNVFEYFNMTTDGKLLLTKSISNIVVVPFEFYIQATDEGTPPLSSEKLRIKIQVKDVNDHPPYFENETVALHIDENKVAWSSVGQLTSKDPDRDSSACYYITEQPTMGLFVVGETNGTVHATRMFDYETQKSFAITVSVKDCSTTVNASVACNESVPPAGSVRSIQTVLIGVNDVNDNPPVFTTNEITFGMRRTTAVNTILDLNLKDYVSDSDFQEYATKETWHVICVHGNGSVVNNKYFSEDRSGYIIVPVEVHDTNNRSITQIRIYLIGDSEIMKMVVFGNKTIVSDRKDDIMGLYSKITDHTFVYDWLEDHKDSNGRVDSFRTDLYFHVVNKDGRILSADEALRLVDRFSYELMQAQSQYSISEVTKWISTEDDGESPLKTVYILVALVVVLTLTIAIIIYVSIVTRNTYKRKLQAATINTHEFKDGKVGNEFIPGSNQYSRQSNPLLNATISEKAVYDNISMGSDNSFDADIIGNGGMTPKYDGLEEQVRVLDMYTEVAPGMGDVESPLDAALRLHDMQNLHDKPETISTEGIVSTHDIDALIFSNPSYLKGLESSEI